MLIVNFNIKTIDSLSMRYIAQRDAGWHNCERAAE